MDKSGPDWTLEDILKQAKRDENETSRTEAITAIQSVAALMVSYYKSMIEGGVPEPAAEKLTIAFQNYIINMMGAAFVLDMRQQGKEI